MAKEKKVLLGGMDKDSDLRLIKNGDYKAAVNARVVTAESEADFGALTNMKGAEKIPQLITSSYPGKDHVCIGSVEDPSFDRIFYFVAYAGLGQPTLDEFDAIWEYHLGTNTAFPVLTSDLLNFNPQHRINDANIVAHRESYAPEGILLFTDGNNPPRRVNIAEEKLLSGLSEVINSSSGKKKYKCNFTEVEVDGVDSIMEYYSPGTNVDDRINAAVCAPLEKPTVNIDRDTSVKHKNYIKSKSFKFKYRYIYRDRQKSAWSPISELAAAETYLPINQTSHSNDDNVILVGVKIDNRYVSGVELAVRDVSTTDQYMLVDTLSYDYQGGWYDGDDVGNKTALTSFPTTDAYDGTNNPAYYDGDYVWYYFYNQEVYSTIDERESNKPFNNIPIKAQTQSVIDGNRVVYGNVTTGRDPYIPGLQLESYISDNLLVDVNTENCSISVASTTNVQNISPAFGLCSCHHAGAYTNFTVALTFPNTIPTIPLSTAHVLTGVQIKDIPFSHLDAQMGAGAWCTCNEFCNHALGTITLMPDTGGNAPASPVTATGDDLASKWHASFINRITGGNISAGAQVTNANTDNGDNAGNDNGVMNLISSGGVTVRAGHRVQVSPSYSGCDPNWNPSTNFIDNFVTLSGNQVIIKFSVISNSVRKLFTNPFGPYCSRSAKSNIGLLTKVVESNNEFDWVSVPLAGIFPSDFSEDNLSYQGKNCLNGGVSDSAFNLNTNSTWEEYMIDQGVGFTNVSDSYDNLNGIDPLVSLAITYTIVDADGDGIPDGISPVKSIFKTGAFHNFGIVYYDKQGRSSSVQDRKSVYIPTHMEVIEEIDDQTAGSLFTASSDWTGSSSNDKQAIFGIQWKVTESQAPSWADYYQIVYTGNQNIEKFEQIITDGFHFPSDPRLQEYCFINVTALKRLIELTGGNASDLEYGPGDRIRIINSYNNNKNSRISGSLSATTINPKFDFNIVDVVDVTRYTNQAGVADELVASSLTTDSSYVQVRAKGQVLDVIFNGSSSNTDINAPNRGDSNVYVVINKRDLDTTDRDTNGTDDDIWNTDGLGNTAAGQSPILSGTLVELYRPKTNTGEEELLFYEFSGLHPIETTSTVVSCEFTAGSTTVSFFNGTSGGFDYSDGIPLGLPVNYPSIGDTLVNSNVFSEPVTISNVVLNGTGTHIISLEVNIEAQASFIDETDPATLGPATSIVTQSHTVGNNSFVKLEKQINGGVNGDAYVRMRPMADTGSPDIKWAESYHFNDYLKSNEWSKGRPNREITYYSETQKEATIIYTDPLIANTYLNGLNSSYEDSYFEEYDKSKGSIQKLHSKDNYLVIFQEDKVSKALVNRNMTFNADGSTQLGLSSQVLSKSVPYAWEGGIGFHPESFAFYGDDMYFYDSQRGEVIKLSDQGVEVISNSGMSSFFRQKSKELVLQDKEIKVRGAYDVSTSEYVLAFDGIYEKEEVNLCELFSNGTGGVWDATVTYNSSDVVSYENPSTLDIEYWVSQEDDNTANTPTTGQFWILCNAQSLNILGCTDTLAVNYNPTALLDDGSCIYECFSDFVGPLSTIGNLVDFDILTTPSTVDDLLIPDPNDNATGTLTITPSIDPSADYSSGFAVFLLYDGDIVAGEFGATGTLLYDGLEAGFYQLLIVDMYSIFENPNYSSAWTGIFEDAGDGLSGADYDNFLQDLELAFEVIQECGAIFDVQVNILACDDPAAINYVGNNIDPALIEALSPSPCFFEIEGCTNPDADNYDDVATLDDGSCVDCVTPAPLNQLFTATITNGSAHLATGTVDLTVTLTNEAENDPDWSPSYEINIYSYDLATTSETIYQTNSYTGTYTGIGNNGEITFSGLPALNSVAQFDINSGGAAMQSYRVEVIAVGMCSDATEILTPEGLGCTDPTGFNYSPLATVDNGGCVDCNTFITSGNAPTPEVPTTTTSSFGSSPGVNDFTVVINQNSIESLVASVGVDVTYAVGLRANGVVIPPSGSFVNPQLVVPTGATTYTVSFTDVPYNGTQTGYSAELTAVYTLGAADTTQIACVNNSSDFITPMEGCVVEGALNYDAIATFDCSGVLQTQSFTISNPAGISAVGTAIGDGTLDASCCGLCYDFSVTPLNEGISIATFVTITDSTSSGGVDLNTGSIDIDSTINLGGSGEYSFTIIDESTGVSHTNGSLPAGDYLIIATDVNYLCELTSSVPLQVGVNAEGCTDPSAQNYLPSATINSDENLLPQACQTCFPDCYLRTVYPLGGPYDRVFAGIFDFKTTHVTTFGADDGTLQFSLEETILHTALWNGASTQVSEFLTFITEQDSPAYVQISLYVDPAYSLLVARGFVGSSTPANVNPAVNPNCVSNPQPGTVLFSNLTSTTFYWKIEYINIPAIDDGSGVSADEFFYSTNNADLDSVTGGPYSFTIGFDIDNCQAQYSTTSIPANDFNGPTPIQYKNLQGCEYSGSKEINEPSCPTSGVMQWLTGASANTDFDSNFEYSHADGGTGIEVVPACSVFPGGSFEWTTDVPDGLGITSVNFTIYLQGSTNSLDNVLATTSVFPASGPTSIVADHTTGVINIVAGATYWMIININYSGTSCQYIINDIIAQCEGCTDPTATNYNPSATISSSCNFVVQGCFAPGFSNTLSLPGETDNGVPVNALDFSAGFPQTVMSFTAPNNTYEVFNDGCELDGCTDPFADNYNIDATNDDGTCQACLESGAFNYESQALNTTVNNSDFCEYCELSIVLDNAQNEEEFCIVSENHESSQLYDAYADIPNVDGPRMEFTLNAQVVGNISSESATIPNALFNNPSLLFVLSYVQDDDPINMQTFTQFNILTASQTFNYISGFVPGVDFDAEFISIDASGNVKIAISPLGSGIKKFEAGTYTAEIISNNIQSSTGGAGTTISGDSCISSTTFRMEEQCPTNLKLITTSQQNSGVAGLCFEGAAVVSGDPTGTNVESFHGIDSSEGHAYVRLSLKPYDLPCWLGWPEDRMRAFDIDPELSDTVINYDSTNEKFNVDIKLRGRATTDIVFQIARDHVNHGPLYETNFQNNDISYCRYLLRLQLQDNNLSNNNDVANIITIDDYKFKIQILNSEEEVDNLVIANADPQTGGNLDFSLLPYELDFNLPKNNYELEYNCQSNFAAIITSGSAITSAPAAPIFFSNFHFGFTASGTSINSSSLTASNIEETNSSAP